VSPNKKNKICTVINASTLQVLQSDVKKALAFGSDYVEIRFDYLHEFDLDKIGHILSNSLHRCVFTCRKQAEGGKFIGTENERIKLLKKLSLQGPAFIDIELSTLKEKPETAKVLRVENTSLIVSWHDFSKTPSFNKLSEVYKEEVLLGDFAKIVTFAKVFSDNAKILSLYKTANNGKLISFCMGDRGIISRILCTTMGSPFTYAALDDNGTAPGQIPIKELRRIYDVI